MVWGVLDVKFQAVRCPLGIDLTMLCILAHKWANIIILHGRINCKNQNITHSLLFSIYYRLTQLYTADPNFVQYHSYSYYTADEKLRPVNVETALYSHESKPRLPSQATIKHLS